MLCSESQNGDGKKFILLGHSVKTFATNLQAFHHEGVVPLRGKTISACVLKWKNDIFEFSYFARPAINYQRIYMFTFQNQTLNFGELM